MSQKRVLISLGVLFVVGMFAAGLRYLWTSRPHTVPINTMEISRVTLIKLFKDNLAPVPDTAGSYVYTDPNPPKWETPVECARYSKQHGGFVVLVVSPRGSPSQAYVHTGNKDIVAIAGFTQDHVMYLQDRVYFTSLPGYLQTLLKLGSEGLLSCDKE